MSFGYGSHLEFQNGHRIMSICTYILFSETCRGKIMVSIPMFSGSINPIRTLIILLDHLVMAAILILLHGRQAKMAFPIHTYIKKHGNIPVQETY